MHTLADMAKALNRPLVYLSGLQTRFGFPVMEAAGYSAEYLEFLRKLTQFRFRHLPPFLVLHDLLRQLFPQPDR